MRGHSLSWLALIPSAVLHRMRDSAHSHHPGPSHAAPDLQSVDERQTGVGRTVSLPQQRQHSDERARHVV